MLFKRLLALFVVILITSCQQEQRYIKLNGFTMGTTYQVTVKTEPKLATQLQKKISSKLFEINLLMSTYIEHSELSLFNKNKSDICIPMSAETLFVIKNAKQVSKQTNGKFDVTLDPLIKEWGFDSKQTNDTIPSRETIKTLLSQIGFSKIQIENDCIKKGNKNLSINLSAIAKGYGVDEIAKLIKSEGITNYLVEIGGETASQGINSRSKTWRLAIEAPVKEVHQIEKIFEPLGMGVATSGDYRNYFEKDGKRYSHTIDPSTGSPITHNLASVTVLHQQTMLADAYATAFMVMGEKESLAFAEENDLAIYLLLKTDQGFVEKHSSQFLKYLPKVK